MCVCVSVTIDSSTMACADSRFSYLFWEGKMGLMGGEQCAPWESLEPTWGVWQSDAYQPTRVMVVQPMIWL